MAKSQGRDAILQEKHTPRVWLTGLAAPRLSCVAQRRSRAVPVMPWCSPRARIPIGADGADLIFFFV